VIDYSTTWCGPCKIVLPKYIELSEKYKNITFLKCIGDSSVEASALMKREGVRSVPTFHLWKQGARVEVVNGARIEQLEEAVISLTK
jgi:thioredoxin 1